MTGKWWFEYRIVPYAESWVDAHSLEIDCQASLGESSTGILDGALPPEGSILKVSHGSFANSGVNNTEDGRGWWVRGYKLTGEPPEV